MQPGGATIDENARSRRGHEADIHIDAVQCGGRSCVR